MRSAAVSLVLATMVGCATSSTQPSALNSAAAEPEPSLSRVEYSGVIQLEAHLANPGDTIELPLRWVQTCDGAGTCLAEETAGEGGEAERIWSTPEATWNDGATHRWPAEKAAHHRRLLSLLGQDETEVRYTHPRLGVQTDRATARDGALAVEFHDGGVAWTGALTRAPDGPAQALNVPEAPPAPPETTPSIVKAADGVWDVRLPELDARSFVLEFDSFLVTVEAPWSSAAGEQVVDLIEQQFPGKPIRYALYSHHHPHASGGLRAFIAAGATVVAPRGHAAYLREVVGRDFSLEPDRLQSMGETPSWVEFEDSFTISERGKSLQVIDIGERSNHTTHYMVFWLPETKALFQGDLGWYTASDGSLRVGQRSAGLLQAIDERNLPVETLWQGWPVNSQAPSLPMSALRDALSKTKSASP